MGKYRRKRKLSPSSNHCSVKVAIQEELSELLKLFKRRRRLVSPVEQNTGRVTLTADMPVAPPVVDHERSAVFGLVDDTVSVFVSPTPLCSFSQEESVAGRQEKNFIFFRRLFCLD